MADDNYDAATLAELDKYKGAEDAATEPLKGCLAKKAKGVEGLCKLAAPSCCGEYKQKQKIYMASWADHKSTDDKAPFCCSLQARAAAPSPFFPRGRFIFILACQRRSN